MVPQSNKKVLYLLPKMSTHLETSIAGSAMMIAHLFGNPAVLTYWTRGFASPDYSGFARSEIDLYLINLRLNCACIHLAPSNRKSALSSAEDERFLEFLYVTGPRMMIAHLFGNPAILIYRTRGFASSDFSDFARSEIVLYSIMQFLLPGQLQPPIHKKRSIFCRR